MSSSPAVAAAPPPARSPATPEQWEQTLAQLRATNEELQRRRAEAEKDRDLFRDLYSKASAHASESVLRMPFRGLLAAKDGGFLGALLGQPGGSKRV